MNLLLVGSSGLVGREVLEAFRKVDYSFPTNSFEPIDTFIAHASGQAIACSKG